MRLAINVACAASMTCFGLIILIRAAAFASGVDWGESAAEATCFFSVLGGLAAGGAATAVTFTTQRGGSHGE
jgi:hypothetical protein